MENKTAFGLTGNQLKIIALITMTIDHIGMYFFPQFLILRTIGRLSMPKYAYMIAEGCRYTRNRKAYLLLTVGVGALCQIVYWIAMGSLYQCILVTFSLSISLIYTLDYAKSKHTTAGWALFTGIFATICFISIWLPRLLPSTDFSISYGIFGILLPVFVYIGNSKAQAIGLCAIGQVLLSYSCGGVQWYGLATLPLLALYNGKRGKVRMKYLFYIYYPAHLAALYLLGLVL